MNRKQFATYATKAENSHGRVFPETQDPMRTDFQRDRDRIVHSTAFRRLQYKTQVFVYHEGDHYRSRLTHSLEVAQISRSIARYLCLDEDLAEAIALAHDFGHTPFGHSGEHALNEVMPIEEGFDHNAQSFDILTKLEHRYALYDGLNLTWETLEGLVKHNGPLIYDMSPHLQSTLESFNKVFDLEITTFAGPEAQVAALADDIAYHSHDIDDGLRAGLLTVEDLKTLPFLSDAYDDVVKKFPDVSPSRHIHEFIKKIISEWIFDVVKESQNRLNEYEGKDVQAIRKADRAVIAFSETMAQQQKTLKEFLYKKMYHHDKLQYRSEQAHQIIKTLYQHFMKMPSDMPEEWQKNKHNISVSRNIANYIAGMTDRFAMTEFQRITNE